ncbi:MULTISPECIES: amino acid ABC transporter permease [Leucobacter]|uniref:amino acid ABC transporter permease n=1 Tax=Leucobacter TaxID=55968 RepID=UPI000E65DFFB|nr:amino acid ABC transporter permease [Leucobacter aridicollis]UTX53118.1 amino acid ABC transporter permease [Leucobacter aridicollis]
MSHQTTLSSSAVGGGSGAIQAIPLRRPGRWVTAGILAFVVFFLMQAWITNERMQWPTVGKYLFAPTVLEGLFTTIWLTVVAMAIGIVGGILIAVMRQSDNPILATISWFFIWLFRGVPLLVQILVWYFLAAIVPQIIIGVPWGPELFAFDTNALITQTTAALLALGLSEAAYMAEIVRAGMSSVDRGQAEAAHALGLTNQQTLRRIVLPQALRVIIPPTGNEVINMLKATSLVSVIAVPELLTSVQAIYSQNFQQIPLLVVACFWYLVVVSVLSVGQHFLERHFARGVHGAPNSRRTKRLPPNPGPITEAVTLMSAEERDR